MTDAVLPPSGPKLTALTLHRYRSFKSETTLELRPLTLLYGRNNAGKSSLLRALPILAASVEDRAPSPWSVGGQEGPGRGATFLDHVWKGPPIAKWFEISLRWGSEGSRLEDKFKLEFVDEDDRKAVVVRSLTIRRDGRQVFEAQAEPYPDEDTYRLNGEGGGARLDFHGLVPSNSSSSELVALSSRLKSLRGGVQWLHGARLSAPGIVKETGEDPWWLYPDGRNAAEKLLAHRDLVVGVNGFYELPEVGRRLSFSEVGGRQHRVLLGSGKGGPSSDLFNVGEGMAQVLPVLVAVESAVKGKGPSLVAAEDPDTHLHEDAKRALADHLAKRIRQAERPATLVLETHSRTFLYATQLAVAEGRLAPEQVQVLWVSQGSDGSSTLEAANILPNGVLDSATFREVLAEDERLAERLLEHRLGMRGGQG